MAGLFGTGARVAQLQQARIQPTGIPGSTFVRPQQREAGGNATALANALGSLNSALQNYAAVTTAQEEDPQSRANREWIAKRQQMGSAELAAEITNGTADGVRVREDALNAMLGERANTDFRTRWTEFYNTEFDRTSGDAATEYERLRQEYAAGLPSEIARGNFYRLTQDHFGAWMQKDTEEKVAVAKQELNTTIVGGFQTAIDDARTIHGKTAAEAADIVFNKSAANRQFLGLSGQEQNDTIFAAAQAYAQAGDEEMAAALLNTARKGADGRQLPALSSIPAYASKSFQLIEQAGSIRDKNVREKGMGEFVKVDDMVLRGAFTEAEAEKYRGKGYYDDAQLASKVTQSTQNLERIRNKQQTEQQKRSLALFSAQEENRVVSQAFSQMETFGGINNLRDIEIPNPSGEGVKTVTKQQQIDAVIEMKEADFRSTQEKLVADGTDPADARKQVNRLRLDWYAGNKIENEQWKNTLDGIAGRASFDTILQKGEVTAYLKDSAALYRDLKASNPAYLSTVLRDPASKEFLETYDLAVTNGQMPEDDALIHAARMVSQPENIKAKSMLSPTDTDKLTRRTLRDLGVDERSNNYAYVSERIRTLSRNGAQESEIKKAVEEDILHNSVPVNGVLVFANNQLPDDFPELMQAEIQKRFERLGKQYGIRDSSQLAVFADGSEARWYVYDKATGRPLTSEPITPPSLEAIRTERRAAQEEQIRKIATAKDADRATLKAEWDRSIAEDQARIDFWRDAATKRRGLRKSLAEGVFNKLQQNLDERKERAHDSIFLTPDQRMRKATDKMLPPDEVEAWKRRNQ